MTTYELFASASSIAAIFFGCAAYLRSKKKDTKQEGILSSDVGYIKAGVDDIKRRQEHFELQHIEVISRITAVEESTKQAHKLIDEHIFGKL